MGWVAAVDASWRVRAEGVGSPSASAGIGKHCGGRSRAGAPAWMRRFDSGTLKSIGRGGRITSECPTAVPARSASGSSNTGGGGFAAMATRLEFLTRAPPQANFAANNGAARAQGQKSDVVRLACPFHQSEATRPRPPPLPARRREGRKPQRGSPLRCFEDRTPLLAGTAVARSHHRRAAGMVAHPMSRRRDSSNSGASCPRPAKPAESSSPLAEPAACQARAPRSFADHLLAVACVILQPSQLTTQDSMGWA